MSSGISIEDLRRAIGKFKTTPRAYPPRRVRMPVMGELFYYVDGSPYKTLFVAVRQWTNSPEDIADYISLNTFFRKESALSKARRDLIKYARLGFFE